MNTTFLRLLAPAAAVAAWGLAPVSPALAQLDEDSGFYLGLAHGETEFFNGTSLCEEFGEEVGEALEGELGQSFLVTESFAELVYATECRQRVTDNSNKFFIGYRVNRAVAVELAKIDFGKAGVALTTDVTAPSGTFRGEAEVEVELDGISLSGMFSVPVGERFGLFARLGVLAWDAKGRGSASGSVPDGSGGRETISERFVASDDGADVHYGVGGRLRLTDHVAVRAEWERYEVVDVEMISAGVEFSF